MKVTWTQLAKLFDRNQISERTYLHHAFCIICSHELNTHAWPGSTVTCECCLTNAFIPNLVFRIHSDQQQHIRTQALKRTRL